MVRFRSSIPAALVAVLSLALAGCDEEVSPVTAPPDPDTGLATTAGDERSYAGAVPAPDFPPDLEWLNTEVPLTFERLRGKIVLLDFWTYGCINCLHIIPDLERLEAEFPDELVVIGVHSAKFDNEADTDNIRQVVLRYGLSHPVVNDRDFRIWRSWGAQAWPTLFLVDPAGNVVGNFSGEGIYPLFQPVIESIVAEFEGRGELDRTPLDLKLEREGLPQTVLAFPGKVLADPDGGRLFIADTYHNRIVVADPGSGEISAVIGDGRSEFVDGVSGSASFNAPQGMALSDDGGTLYVADTGNHAIRSVDIEAGEVRTVAGIGRTQWPPAEGVAPDVPLNSPWDLALDDGRLYIAMAGFHQLWFLDLDSGLIGPLAGNGREGWTDGEAESAELAQPSGVTVGPAGEVYFADSEASSVRRLIGDRVTTLAGAGTGLFDYGDSDGIGGNARFQHPLGVAYADGLVYVADTYNSRIRVVDAATGGVTTLAGDGHGWRDGASPLFYEPGGIDAAAGKLYVADTNNHAVRIVDPETGTTETLVLRGIERFTSPSAYEGRTVDHAPVVVGAGPGEIVLDVRLPSGYKPNDLAPSRFGWEGDEVVAPSDPVTTVAGPSFPLRFAARFAQGSGSLTGDLTLYYCEAERQSLCLVDQVRIVVPVTVREEGPASAVVTYAVDVADLSP